MSTQIYIKMMSLQQILSPKIQKAVNVLFELSIDKIKDIIEPNPAENVFNLFDCIL